MRKLILILSLFCFVLSAALMTSYVNGFIPAEDYTFWNTIFLVSISVFSIGISAYFYIKYKDCGKYLYTDYERSKKTLFLTLFVSCILIFVTLSIRIVLIELTDFDILGFIPELLVNIIHAILGGLMAVSLINWNIERNIKKRIAKNS